MLREPRGSSEECFPVSIKRMRLIVANNMGKARSVSDLTTESSIFCSIQMPTDGASLVSVLSLYLFTGE